MQKTQAGTTQTVSRKEITKVDQLTSASEDKYRNTHYYIIRQKIPSSSSSSSSSSS